MASIIQVGEKWRAQVRRRGHRPQTRTFDSQVIAKRWARKVETAIDEATFHDSGKAEKTSLADLIKRYREERVGEIGRSHGYALDQLTRRLGETKLSAITSDLIIEYARSRTCKPVTWAAELSYLGTIFRLARGVWKLPIVGDPVGDARVALGLLGFKLKGRDRDRRPTRDEIDRLRAHFDAKSRQRIPMSKVLTFAIATTMRAEEITRIRWDDLNEKDRTVLIRDRKDPKEKEGNDQRVPLLLAAWAIVKKLPRSDERIFPFNSKTFSSIFPRACQALQPPIKNLRFHDLRHEGISRLFEAGYQIPEVAVFSGHKDWKMLARYTQLAAKSLHRPAQKTKAKRR